MLRSHIRLNIGGSIFETTEDTLNRIEGTMLKMLCQENWADAKQQEIFIDRDPTHFRLILNFLRDGALTLPVNEKDLEEIEREANFYGITELAVACRTRLDEIDYGDIVKWKPEAADFYWKSFVRFWVDDSLVLPFTCERNGHLLARCIACDKVQEPKCSYTFDIPEDSWKAMAHHMLYMCGTVIQLVDGSCCLVQWGNGRIIHLPLSALMKLP